MIPKVKIGEKAPDFTLQDQNGESHTLSDYKGQWVLVYFYPRDNTPGCTTEATWRRVPGASSTQQWS